MAKKGIHNKIDEIAIDDSGSWKEKVKRRKANRNWLQKSQQVAIKVLYTLDKKEMQQKDLAEAMNVSPQQVSKIVKGKENLTLQTISKLEQVLDISLFEVPMHFFTAKVESKKGAKTSYDKKNEKQYVAKEPLESVVNSSWNPEVQRKTKLSLVG